MSEYWQEPRSDMQRQDAEAWARRERREKVEAERVELDRKFWEAEAKLYGRPNAHTAGADS